MIYKADFLRALERTCLVPNVQKVWLTQVSLVELVFQKIRKPGFNKALEVWMTQAFKSASKRSCDRTF